MIRLDAERSIPLSRAAPLPDRGALGAFLPGRSATDGGTVSNLGRIPQHLAGRRSGPQPDLSTLSGVRFMGGLLLLHRCKSNRGVLGLTGKAMRRSVC